MRLSSERTIGLVLVVVGIVVFFTGRQVVGGVLAALGVVLMARNSR